VVHLTDYMVGDRRKDPASADPYGVNLVVPHGGGSDGFPARMGIFPGQQVLLCLARFENRTKRQNRWSVPWAAAAETSESGPVVGGEGPDRRRSRRRSAGRAWPTKC
jgi:hypothetical protein